MPPLKLALVGCGRIAQIAHLQCLLRLPNARVVAIAEPDEERRGEAARRAPGAARFATYGDLLEGSDAEAIVLALPPALHAESAVAAFRAGRHVYLEKPIAVNLPDAAAVLAAWRPTGLVGMVGFNFRFNATYLAAKEQIHSGRLGDLAGVRSTFCSAAQTLPNWKRGRESGGGALLQLASHHIDLIHFLFEQQIVMVSAVLRSQRSESDSAMLLLRLSSGLVVQSFCSLAAVTEDRFEIYGSAGKLTLDRYAADLELRPPGYTYGRLARLREEAGAGVRGLRRLIRAPGESSYGNAFGAFADAARARRPATPDLDDGYRSLAVIDAAERSALTGQVVAPALTPVAG